MVGYYLPEDVLVEVLARLPVKSLLRFKCVSKSLRDILKDPSFIAKHYLTQATSNHGSTVLAKRLNWSKKICELVLMSDDAQATKFTYLNLPFFKEIMKDLKFSVDLEVAGPINGIVLVSNRDGDLYLWNPATRKFKALPCSSFAYSLPEKFSCHWCRVGFGIDPITNDYKVVRIWIFSGEKTMYKVELLSLSVDSCKPCSTWKNIDAIPPLHLHLDKYQHEYDTVYLKGKYYWCYQWCSESKGRDVVVWFDLGNEVFGLIELPEVRPDLLDYYDNYGHRMVVVKDSIAMIQLTHRVDDNYDNFLIWIMNECDAGVSWTYYATVGPFTAKNMLLGLWKGEELVVVIEDDLVMIHIPSGQVVSYDTKRQETKDTIDIKDLVNAFDREFPLANYNESLVSVIGED